MTYQVWELLQFGYSLVQFGLKSYVRFQMEMEIDLKSQVWYLTKIVRHEVQLPLYYIHLISLKYSTCSVKIFHWCSTELV